jgi:hypothetical protein
LVAAVSFTLLTSAAGTSKLRVTGTVERSFRPAYDILVRPAGSFSRIERERGLVQENYLSGIFGGITFDQYRAIKAIPGVDVAAPIANIGYILPFDFVPVTINDFLSQDPDQLYRLRFDWLANGRTSQYPDSPLYVYFTRRASFDQPPHDWVDQILPSGRTTKTPCQALVESRPLAADSDDPFAAAGGIGMMCFSERTPDVQEGEIDYGRFPPGVVGEVSTVSFPILIAAIDPEQESRLVGLDRALVDGRMLRSTDSVEARRVGKNARYRFVPIVASTRTYVDEVLRVSVEQLPVRRPGERADLLRERAFGYVSRLRGDDVGTVDIPIADLYEGFLDDLSERSVRIHFAPQANWTASPVAYEPIDGDRLRALTTRNEPDVFRSGYYGAGWAPTQLRDIQYRQLTLHDAASNRFAGTYSLPAIEVVGRFDPERLPGFDPLSRVPLETYYPPRVEPVGASSRAALGGRPLLPTQNLGDYVAQPPTMLTNLRGLRAFVDRDAYEGANEDAPISVIRVRVAGVTGLDEVSRERIRSAAQAIHERTGLAVDVTAGSSPHPLVIDLPAGKYGRPPLTVREGWVEKGVAVEFVEAIDGKSLALFGLILVICGFFLANGTFASVRSRRGEIGTLLCLGWSQGAIFRAVLGEVALVGLIAGIVGAALAAVLVPALSLQMSVEQTLFAVPIAVVLAVAAGLVPAWQAARSVPMDAVRPAVSERGLHRHARGVAGVALANLARVPSRAALGAAGLAIGVAALTILLALNSAFQGVLVGTLLGNAVSVQVRGVDLASVAFTIALGGFSVADVLFLNMRARAPELVTLRTVGWSEEHLRRLVLLEGVAIGAIGCLTGALLGGGIASLVRGVPLATIAAASFASAAAGIAVAGLASLVPLAVVDRLTPPTVLAEE